MSRTIHHTPNYINGDGNFNLSYHLEMVSDYERTKKAKDAIDFHIKPDSIFCELGCGTGIFSIYAAKRCKKVYAVEKDKTILEIARKNAKNNNLAEKIEFIHADAIDIKLKEKVDIIFCEMLSIWLINEPQVMVMNNAIKHNLKSGGKVIPEKVINLAELGNINYQFDGVEIKTSFAEFTGIRSPNIATESRFVNSIDFYRENPKKIKTSVMFTSVIQEKLNCVRLFSIVQFAPKINFHSTDTLMPITTVPLKESLEVEVNENINLNIEFKHLTNVDEAYFHVNKIIG
ncbi:MAG: methyltransferase domain-containing protein [Nitrospinae bacterium]|nr:methyltransferase domain-containing protein [Nitrospinota bacterium]